jgi:hypothetical protein
LTKFETWWSLKSEQMIADLRNTAYNDNILLVTTTYYENVSDVRFQLALETVKQVERI